MFAALILVCAFSVAKPDCDMTSARRFVQVQGVWELPVGCLTAGELWAAEHQIAVEEDSYMKISCTRSNFLNAG